MKESLANYFHGRREEVIRTVLAGALLGAGIGCTPSRLQTPECPNNSTEVAYLTGGNPKKWRIVNFSTNVIYWEFKSEQPEVLNGPIVGRLDVPNMGRINNRLTATAPTTAQATEAWYVCPDPGSPVRSSTTPTQAP